MAPITHYIVRRNLTTGSTDIYQSTGAPEWKTAHSFWLRCTDNRDRLVDTACEHQTAYRDEVIRPGQLDPESDQYDESAAAIVAGRILGADVAESPAECECGATADATRDGNRMRCEECNGTVSDPDDEPDPEPIGKDIEVTRTGNTFFPCCQRNRSLGHSPNCEVTIATRVNVTLTRAAGWVAYNCPAITAEKWRALIASAFLSWLPHIAERPEPVLALVRLDGDLVPTVMAREQVTDEPVCDVLHGDGSWEVN